MRKDDTNESDVQWYQPATTTGAIGPLGVHPPVWAPAGLSLSSQRVRLTLYTSTQRSIL